MKANLPAGVTPRQFGQSIMRWGRGSAAARRRMATLSASELTTAGVTSEMAANWARAYEAVIALAPDNPSAAGRAELMRHAANLLRSS